MEWKCFTARIVPIVSARQFYSPIFTCRNFAQYKGSFFKKIQLLVSSKARTGLLYFWPIPIFQNWGFLSCVFAFPLFALFEQLLFLFGTLDSK